MLDGIGGRLLVKKGYGFLYGNRIQNVLACVRSHQLGLTQYMAFHGSFQGGFGCTGW